MQSAVLTNFFFKSLFESEKILGTLSPKPQLGTLTGTLIIEKDRVGLLVRDALATVFVKMSCDVVLTGEPIALMIEYQKLLYILKAYKEKDLKTFQIICEVGDDTSKFVISTSTDTLQLPHGLTDYSQAIGYLDRDDRVYNTFWTNVQDKTNFLSSLQICLQFVSSNEKRNNALAIYSDKIVVNDERHVFVLKLSSSILDVPTYLPIHRQVGKVMSLLGQSGSEIQTINFIDKTKRIEIETDNLFGIFNNAISNISPPSEADLDSIRPSKRIMTLKVEELKESTSFFSGFFTANMEWNPIMIRSDGTSCKLLLRNSGVVGYGSCNVERELSTTNLSEEEIEATVINDSLKLFLSRLSSKTESVDIFIDPVNSPAVYLNTEGAEIYLARLVG